MTLGFDNLAVGKMKKWLFFKKLHKKITQTNIADSLAS